MNFQQLEYVLAVNTHRHFVDAANKCNITQPTLSMMIQKLEQELGIIIFDRTKKPVEPTADGLEIIERAKQIINEVEKLKAFSMEVKGEVSGEIKIGIIPTLAPYLLPLFLNNFVHHYPLVRIVINEMVTHDIIQKLKSGELDFGLLATPLHEPQFVEHHLFYEAFYVYLSEKELLFDKKYIIPNDLNLNQLWLLEEGHCLRNQVFNLCELSASNSVLSNLHYEAGSIETLINLVDKQHGITVIPQLAALNLSTEQQNKLKEFAKPVPMREISLVVSKNFPRKKLLEKLKLEIKKTIPLSIAENSKPENSVPVYKN
jgi:LysR family transcriptional regulator, hydrogen peroxide-inducible genes activator